MTWLNNYVSTARNRCRTCHVELSAHYTQCSICARNEKQRDRELGQHIGEHVYAALSRRENS